MIFPFDALGFLFYLLSLLLNFSFIPSTRSGRAGPLLSAPAESRQRLAQGASPPCESPWRSRWTRPAAPSLARGDWPNSSPLARLELRCSWGKASAYALATPAPPPLLARMAPQGSPKGKVRRLRACWGLRPLTPLRSPLGNGRARQRATRCGFRRPTARKLLPRSG